MSMDHDKLYYKISNCHNCKLCKKNITGKKIFMFKPSSGHRDTVHLCKDCINFMYSLIDDN